MTDSGTAATRRALVLGAGASALPGMIGRAEAAALWMRLSGSLLNNPKCDPKCRRNGFPP